MPDFDHGPIALIEDRYFGTYSKGRWLAVSEADLPFEGTTRAGYVLGEDGPHGQDCDAMVFWMDPPAWIAVGDTPDEALAAIRSREPVREPGPRTPTA